MIWHGLVLLLQKPTRQSATGGQRASSDINNQVATDDTNRKLTDHSHVRFVKLYSSNLRICGSSIGAYSNSGDHL